MEKDIIDFAVWYSGMERKKVEIAYQRYLREEKPETTSENSLHKHIVNGSACATHKIKQLPYLQWHEWAESLDKKGIKQVQCDKCKRWLFPEEF